MLIKSLVIGRNTVANPQALEKIVNVTVNVRRARPVGMEHVNAAPIIAMMHQNVTQIFARILIANVDVRTEMRVLIVNGKIAHVINHL